MRTVMLTAEMAVAVNPRVSERVEGTRPPATQRKKKTGVSTLIYTYTCICLYIYIYMYI